MAQVTSTLTEFVVALAAPVGVDLKFVGLAVTDAFRSVGYDPAPVIQLSTTFEQFELSQADGTPIVITPAGGPEDDRIWSLMDAGNALRRVTERKEIVAAIGSIAINGMRQERAQTHSGPATYVMRSLKRPEEVNWLRGVYEAGFLLVAATASRWSRIESLAKRIAGSRNTADWQQYASRAEQLVVRDEGEVSDTEYGQRLADTFALADLFLSFGDDSLDTQDASERIRREITRFIELLSGRNDLTPTMDEAAMFHAHAAAVRSGSLARQVGAAISSERGDLLAIGCNDVPRPGGGLYWESDIPDHRDIHRDRDTSNVYEEEIIGEILKRFRSEKWFPPPEIVSNARAIDQLSETMIRNLLEFSRATHAEMEAILAAGRARTDIRDCRLYTTTFPCHECAKIIITAGIKEVIYIEPYPKSKTADLYATEVLLEKHALCRSCQRTFPYLVASCPCSNADLVTIDPTMDNHLVRFRPFAGVGPRRYLDLFAMVTSSGTKYRRKDQKTGNRRKWTPAKALPRLQLKQFNYLEDESVLSKDFKDILSKFVKPQSEPRDE